MTRDEMIIRSTMTTIETSYGTIRAPFDVFCTIADALDRASLSYREDAEVMPPDEAAELVVTAEEYETLSCEITNRLLDVCGMMEV